MGLDITAYSKVMYLETMSIEAWEAKYWRHEGEMPFKTAHATHWERAFAVRAAPIVKDGVYRIDGERFDFRAGSYSSYNEWRNWLSLTMLDVLARTVWENRAQYVGKPFYELIGFSDAEGIIGSVVAQKLAADFSEHQSKIERYKEGELWHIARYADWRKAFELAADNGFVAFH